MSNLSIKVRIENFQSIENVEFEIDKYTVLTGPSNSGKSAICRAIEGALFNRSGDGFVRNGEKFAKVTIQTDSCEIVWTKGSGKNHYTVNGELFDKVGTDVPKHILDMRFTDIELSRSKLRPQMGTDQFDILFLIREQGSVISEVFSVLGRLDVITKAGKECSTDLKGKKSLLKTRYDDLASVDKKLANYQGFERVVLAADSLDADKVDIDEDTAVLSKVVDLNKELNKIKLESTYLAEVPSLQTPQELELKDFSTLNHLSKLNAAYRAVNVGIDSLMPVENTVAPSFSDDKPISLLKQLIAIKGKYTTVTSLMEHLAPLETIQAPEDINQSDLRKLEGLKKAKLQILSLDSQISNISQEVESANESIAETEEELHSLLENLSECPLCNQVIEASYVH